MNEIRSYASLSGSLLARKGGAKPAMRPRPLSTGQMLDDLGWDDMGDPFDNPSDHVPSSIAALTPAPKAPREDVVPVHVQQRALSSHFAPAEPAAEVHSEAQPEPEPAPAPEAAPEPTRVQSVVQPIRRGGNKRKNAAQERPAGRKAAFTLRLDTDRHLRLRLASAVTGKSSQQLVTAALDTFLESLPEVGSLARQLPARTGTGN